MTGRPTLLTAELHKEICDNLTLGMPIADVCQHVGIDESTYYRWRNRGIAELKRIEDNPRARIRQDESLFCEFYKDTTRAQVAARRASVAAVRTWLTAQQTRNVTTKTTSETRIRKVKRDGAIVEEPYTYTKTETIETVTHHPPDWRAGIEYLKRRAPDEWSDKVTITIEDLRQQAIDDIRAGRLAYEALAMEDKALADELFASAGVPIEAGTGATE